MISAKYLKVFFLCGFALIFFGFISSGNLSKVIGSNSSENIIPSLDDYVGSESCKTCHEDQFKQIEKTVHGKIQKSRWGDKVQGCESCHGAGKLHIDNGGDKTKIISFKNRTAKENSESCLVCHSQTSAHATWKGSKHESAGLSCMDCHSTHHSPSAKDSEKGRFSSFESETKLLKGKNESETCYQCHKDVRKSEVQRSTHLFKNEDREARMSCSACHDAHGSTSEKLMKSTSINDTCYSCHTEKRGPFLWEHAPARENCASCHKAHGSNHPTLLKAREPMLCQSCHIQGRHQTVAGKSNSAFMFNRSCSNCHTQVHGSNHPSGINLQR